MKTRSALVHLGTLLLALLAVTRVAAQSAPADLDEYVAKTMKTFEVPGLSVAIVKDGKVVVAKGYGVKKLGEPAAVDENTLFGIGSNTKAFTAAALATLVDEGKIAWDDPVYERLKGFQMYDPYVSKEMRIRDLLCHRSGLGLGEGDLMFWPHTNFTRDEVVYRLRFLKPATRFRSRWASGCRCERQELGRLCSRAHFCATGNENDEHQHRRLQIRRRLCLSAFEGRRKAAGNSLRESRQCRAGRIHQFLGGGNVALGDDATEPGQNPRQRRTNFLGERFAGNVDAADGHTRWRG
jgi:hypothetical protein